MSISDHNKDKKKDKKEKKAEKKNCGKLHSITAYPESETEITASHEFQHKGWTLLIPFFLNIPQTSLESIYQQIPSPAIKHNLGNAPYLEKMDGDISAFMTGEDLLPAIVLVNLGREDKFNQTVFANKMISALEKCIKLGWSNLEIVLVPELQQQAGLEQLVSWTASVVELARYKNRFLALEPEKIPASNSPTDPQSTPAKIDSKDEGPLNAIHMVLLSKPQVDKQKIVDAIHEGSILGRMTNGARQAVAFPGNIMTPKRLWQLARKEGKKYGVEASRLTEQQLVEMGMEGILAVARGSQEKPQLIILSYTGNEKKADIDLGIVGKGLTFDTGGISLKPPLDMHEMKGDMAGAAAALYGTMAIARAKLKINVLTMIGAAENMPDGKAQKPGDIYTSYKGLSVEVLNTDAEGRLVLADVLTYMSEHKPKQIIDLATLTGACLIALGNYVAGCFSNSDSMRQAVFQAGEKSGDRVWPMPLYADYSEDIKSEIADLANIGPRWGGAITAATFLNHFVPSQIPWTHLDIAGTFMLNKHHGMHRKGATGFGVRLLYQVAQDLARSNHS